MIPTIGRIVHFNYNGAWYAAIITYVWDGQCVNLYVFENGLNQLGQILYLLQ